MITRRRRIVGSAVAAVIGSFGVGAAVVGTARADGPTTFDNTTSIAVPATGSDNQTGPAFPYPSTILVSGMTGLVTSVTVALSGVSATSLGDFDVMLVSPTGQSLVVLSDAGDPATLTTAGGATYTFADSAAVGFPQAGSVPTGTYRPTNSGGGIDSFPSPGPMPSSSTSLAGAFTGIAPNGTWSLFVVDDATGDGGSISGGWSLTITADATVVATSTAVSSSPNPSTAGATVTLGASVTAGGDPVTVGSVQFSDSGTALGAPVAVDGGGRATLTTSSLAERAHQITATYSGASELLPSNGSLTQVVDNATVVVANTYCNTGLISVPSVGVATPYPSRIFVTGVAGTIDDVQVRLSGVAHTSPGDLDVMLVSPSGGSLVLMSDAGGLTSVNDVGLTFSDEAGSEVPVPLVSGTYRPTDLDLGGQVDMFPAPAPIVGGATTLSALGGTDPVGTWTLYVVDDATGDSGSIDGGWCLTIAASQSTDTTIDSTPNPSTEGQSVTITATVVAGAIAPTEGTVQFEVDGVVLGAAVPLGVDGTARLTTSTLVVGSHTVDATYSGSAAFRSSSDTLTHDVDPVAAAGGPYTITEGDSLTLDGTGSTAGIGTTYSWDLDGDGDYTDATGVSPTLTWGMLESFGIDDGPGSHTIALEVRLDGRSGIDTVQLTITNIAPDTVVTGGRTATAGSVFTVEVGADDPSSADMAALFTYTADWGDGSPIITVVGSSDRAVSHTYSLPGIYAVVFTATDRDGATSTNGSAVPVEIVVGPSAVTTTTTTTSTTPTATTPSTNGAARPPSSPATPVSGLPATGSNSLAVLALAGLLTLVGLTAVGLAAHRRRSQPGLRSPASTIP